MKCLKVLLSTRGTSCHVAVWFDVNITFFSSLFTFQLSLTLSLLYRNTPNLTPRVSIANPPPFRLGTILPPNVRSTSLPSSSTCDPSNPNIFLRFHRFWYAIMTWFFLALDCRSRAKRFRSFDFAEGKMRPVFCGNLDFDARQSDVERLFRRYGKVDRVDMKSGISFFVFVFFFNLILFSLLVLFLRINFICSRMWFLIMGLVYWVAKLKFLLWYF